MDRPVCSKEAFALRKAFLKLRTERYLLSLETVQLASLAKFIQAELQRRAEYALRYGTNDTVHKVLTSRRKRRLFIGARGGT